MRIAITGSSGLIGSALTESLPQSGHTVVPVVRSTPGQGEIGWKPSDGRLDADDLVGIDAIVHLAGAGIGAKRWDEEYKQLLVESRVNGTELLAKTVADMDNGPRTIISGSAIGYYGDRGDEVLTEDSDPGDSFLADLCVKWEAAMDPARAAGIRVAHIRTGIVLAPGGGALAKMLPLFKFGLGGRLGSGEQYMPWISLTDEVRAIEYLLTHEVSGPVNLTGPAPVTNREFTEVLGEVLSRPTVLPVPEFGPKLLLGAEMAQALLFDSARVHPSVLNEAEFRFEHDEIRSALRAELDV